MQRLQRWFIRWPIGMGVAFGVVLGLVAFVLDRASGPVGTVIADAVLPLGLGGGAIISALIGDRRRGGVFDDRAGTVLAALVGVALMAVGTWQWLSASRVFGGSLLLVIGVAVVALCVDRARRWERS